MTISIQLKAEPIAAEFDSNTLELCFHFSSDIRTFLRGDARQFLSPVTSTLAPEAIDTEESQLRGNACSLNTSPRVLRQQCVYSRARGKVSLQIKDFLPLEAGAKRQK
jgi:hypothetical protein